MENTAAFPSARLISVDKLIPYERNAKLHPASQIKALAKIFKRFGFDQAIVVDADMVIIKGHGRRLAAIKAGIKEVPVIVRSDLTAAEARASRIADNKIGETDWDTEALLAEVHLIQQSDKELTKLLGIADAEMAEILGTEPEPLAPPVQPGEKEFLLVLECGSEQEQSELFEELKERGYTCKIM